MATTNTTREAVTPDSFLDDKSNRHDLLRWLNNLMKTSFTDVMQTNSGACHCQLMDWLFPGSVDVSRVRFQADGMDDYKHNFTLLQEAFRGRHVTKDIPVEELVSGDLKANFHFLKWFKAFFTENLDSQEYDVVAARSGQDIHPTGPVPNAQNQKIRKRDSVSDSTEDEACNQRLKKAQKIPYDPAWKDQCPWAEPSPKGEHSTYCSVCKLHLSTSHRGLHDIRRHEESTKHRTRSQKTCGGTARQTVMEEPPPPLACSAAAVRFILKHCYSGASVLGERAARHYPRYMLGLRYPGDVVSACKQTPYSLYVYGGLALGEAQGLDDSTPYCAVLVGYFDAKASRYVVRLLDVVEDGGGGGAAVADVVKRFDDGRAANLVAVYSQGQAPGASQRMCSALRDMNPHVVALAGLYEAADRAWRAAAAKLSLSQVQELMADLHAHHCSAPTPKDGPLGALFTSPDGAVRKTPPNLYDNAGCLDLCLAVGKLARSWDELAAYFKSSREGGDGEAGGAEAIRSRLQDVGLRATVMFLEHAMGPLHDFQKHLQHATAPKADLACVLEAAGSMLHTYAHRLLQPQAAVGFLEGSAGLRDKSSRLPAAELVGRAGDGPDLKACEGTAASEALRELAESFYEAVTRSLAESLPLRAAALKTMAQLLDPYRRLDVTSEAVRELGSTLGLCKSSGEACSLSVDFLAFHNAKRVEVQKRGGGGSAAAPSSSASTEQRWSAVLKDTESTSVLRKLLLGLMSLPCPPLEARRLYDQAVLSGDALLFSGREEMPGTTTGEEESDSASCTTSPHGRANHSGTPRSRANRSVSDLVKTCEIRLTKIKRPTNGSDDDRSGKDEGPVRRDSGRQSSLRKKPPARTLFQAGKGTWDRPVDPEQRENGREKDDGSDSVKDTSGKSSTKGRGGRRSHVYQDGHDFQPAELVWGKLKLKKKWTWWPGMVMAWQKTSGPIMPGFRRVEWFGDGLYSEMHIYSLLPFSAFSKCFSKTDYTDVPLYADAVYQIVELAAQRCAKSFGEAEGDKVKELSCMLDWAMGGFLPSGPAGFDPPAGSTGTDPLIDCPSDLPDDSDSDFKAKTKDSDSDFQPMATDKTKDSDSDVQPTIAPAKRKYNVLSKSKNRTSVTYSREVMIKDVVKNKKKLEDFCLACGAPETEVHHPLFEGSLCLKCKENFIETLYRYDEADGYQSYCTVCCEGQEVVLCGIRSCCRCFCKGCLDILVRPGTFDQLKLIDPWNCFMCDPEQCGGGGHLKRRDDWSTKVQQFFTNNSAMEFKPHRVYPSIPAQQRRPMKVLSLFDGIATGYLTLKQLGFKIDRYVASEICDDSIAVGMVRHEGKIEHVNDVRTITRKHLAEWGPFDVLIGGSPCNDLSMVNPLRKGLYGKDKASEGTGRLFFEFYRILTILRPREDDDRPFFWLFENVVFMAANDKADIGRFLECNPIFIDAVKVSPAHRARYFWGNLPGMNRPLATSLDDKVNLQDCLENGRVAKFDKVRTITTKSNSIRQGKTGPLPVTMNDKEDYLWSTELEEIFGFPKHYTDVNNMGRSQRQRLLGRSWSVPVIRHLFAPLKDYFECQSIN